MVRPQLQSPRLHRASGLRAQLDLLAPEFRKAIHEAVAAYERLGVRYVLIGGVAAGAYGCPRATNDIDFLVSDEAFNKSGAIISFRTGIPIEIHRVPIDNIQKNLEYVHMYQEAIDRASWSNEPGRVRIATAGMVAAIKLVTGRASDITDIVEMIQAGSTDPGRIFAIVQAYNCNRLQTNFSRMMNERDATGDQ